MNLEDVAVGVQNWARSNHMMAGLPAASNTYDNALIREVFGAVGVPNAVNVLQNRGVTYVGIDESTSSVVIFTEKRLRAADIRLLQAAAYRTAEGELFQVNFLECGSVSAGGPPRPPAVAPYHEHHGRYTCGGSIFVGSEKGAGTLGCLVLKNGELYGLSNNHVIGGCNYAPLGLPVIIPGLADVTAGGKDPETVGHVSGIYPLIDGLPDVVNCADNLDAAIFKVTDPDRVSSMQRGVFDTPANVLPLAAGMDVEKVGRTTGHTTGTVVAKIVGHCPIEFPIPLFGGKKVVFFRDMFAIKPLVANAFSVAGDSGSLIVHVDPNGNRHAVGLVVGGSPEGLCLALSIDRIVNHFGVTLVSGHNV